MARSARDGVHAISDLPGLLPEADVVVLLAPVTSETIGMVDAAFLAGMKAVSYTHLPVAIPAGH